MDSDAFEGIFLFCSAGSAVPDFIVWVHYKPVRRGLCKFFGGARCGDAGNETNGTSPRLQTAGSEASHFYSLESGSSTGHSEAHDAYSRLPGDDPTDEGRQTDRLTHCTHYTHGASSIGGVSDPLTPATSSTSDHKSLGAFSAAISGLSAHTWITRSGTRSRSGTAGTATAALSLNEDGYYDHDLAKTGVVFGENEEDDESRPVPTVADPSARALPTFKKRPNAVL
jgi:hypothetical protein